MTNWITILIALEVIVLPAQPAMKSPARPSAAPASRPTTQPAAAPAEGPPVWRQALPEAYLDAQQHRRPVLLYIGAESCAWCRQLEKEFEKPKARAALGSWTLAYLDYDKSMETARRFAIGTPALRVLTPTGRVVAQRDGYQAADELIAFLAAHREQALAELSEELTTDKRPGPAELEKIISHLLGPDPLAREAAIRRLLPHPQLAADRVARTLAEGNLSQRLAALELLEAWNAPVDGIDPWDPQTLTPSRIDTLNAWAKSIPAANPATQPAGDLAAAQRDLRLLLEAPTYAEMLVVLERLARVGDPLLPLVHQQQVRTSDDESRRRLALLRYRLTASDRLAMIWPGGLERLASADPAQRHAALDELATRATPADHRLLLELFSDRDSLVRERALRLLQTVGGEQTNAALVRLLHDPEPNVRAAVLKQLAANPSTVPVDELVRYLGEETDEDLIVHAARVLQEVTGDASVDALKGLLTHESWRVRGEAAEALHQKARRASGDAAAVASIHAALGKLAEDPDGFVASRAVLALSESNSPGAAEAMLKGVLKHPDMAPELLKILRTSGTGTASLVNQFKELTTHPDPRIRGTAVSAILLLRYASAGKEFEAAMKDPDRQVRLAALSGLFDVIDARKPGQAGTTGLFGFGVSTPPPDPEKWLADFRSGRRRAKWTRQIVPEIKELLASDDPQIRVAAAKLLVPLGEEELALPVLRDAGQQDPSELLASVLPWLPPEKRLEVFDELISGPLPEAQRAELIEQLTRVPTPASAGPLWKVLAQSDGEDPLVQVIFAALRKIYLGNEYGMGEALTAAQKKAALNAAQEQLGGTELQKLLALSLLASVSPEKAAEAARNILNDTAATPALREDALQVLLLSEEERDAHRSAVSHLGDPMLRKPALRYLAHGASGMQTLRGQLYLYSSRASQFYVSSDTPPVLAPPAGLTPELLAPVLASDDPEAAAMAGYLLALLGDRSGLEPLADYWRKEALNEEAWKRLVYRAVVALGDDGLTPLLAEVYATYPKGDYYLREFYWTVRQMKGKEVLALRKRIRDEVGMESLR